MSHSSGGPLADCAQNQARSRGPGSGPTDRPMYRAHGRWYGCNHHFPHQNVDVELIPVASWRCALTELEPSSSQSFQGRVSDRVTAHLRNRLTAGLFVLLPILFTLLVLRVAFGFVDGILSPAVERILDRTIPGLGIVALIVIVYVFGVLTMSRLGLAVLKQLQRPMLAVPVVRTIFSVGQKIVDSMSGESAAGLSRVVMIEYPRRGIWSAGFLTGFTTVGQDRRLALVYLPTAPMPNSGWIAYVPFEDVYDTDLSTGQMMQIVLSSGIEYPDSFDMQRIPELAS